MVHFTHIGGPEKCALSTSAFGYAHAIDYKALVSRDGDDGAQDLQDKLKAVAPDGIDMWVGSFEDQTLWFGTSCIS